MELPTRETVARVLRKTLHRHAKEVMKRAITVLRSKIRPLGSMLFPKWPGLNSSGQDKFYFSNYIVVGNSAPLNPTSELTAVFNYVIKFGTCEIQCLNRA